LQTHSFREYPFLILIHPSGVVGEILLVSHWPVETNFAVELTTGIFEEMKKNPEIGRAEALRRSRIRLINNQAHPEYAHPYFWAPFVVVGEGGRIQTQN